MTERITDKQRLDWLEHGQVGKWQGSPRTFMWWAADRNDPYSDGNGNTVRQAIDAAIKAGRKKK